MQQAYNAANTANYDRYGQILGGYDQLAQDTQQLAGTQRQQALQQQAGAAQRTLSDFDVTSGQIGRGYQDRLGRNLGYVEDVGAYERDRIARSSQQGQARADQSAINRGLYNTTVTGAMQRGVQSDAAQQNLALSDQLARMRADIDTRLSGDALSAQQSQQQQRLGYMSQASGQQAQTQRFYDEMLGRVSQQVPSERLRFMEARTDEGPSQESMANIMLQAGQQEQAQKQADRDRWLDWAKVGVAGIGALVPGGGAMSTVMQGMMPGAQTRVPPPYMSPNAIPSPSTGRTQQYRGYVPDFWPNTMIA
jgi:hypothetical protein